MGTTRFLASLTAVSVLWAAASGAALAQPGVEPKTAEAVTNGDLQRYSLAASEGDILRVDRQNGTVSICKQKNDAWRCSPVPLAEDAYQAEINALSEEIERLTVRLEELESSKPQEIKPLPPGAALDRPANGAKPEKDPEPKTPDQDEEELEKVLSFTETAMRRFFGMVRELQKDLDDSGN